MLTDLEQLKDSLLSGHLTIRELISHHVRDDGDIPIYTTCRVFTLHPKEHPDNVAGYYKEEKYGLFGGAIMNRITWEVAKLLHLERGLVPSEKIEPFTVGEKHYQGGMIQVTQPGIKFMEYLDQPEKRKSTILKDTLIDSLFSSIILGMFDAHTQNIIIDPEGFPHFFDLTCSLPHSNEYLDRGGYLICPYRCKLLSLSESSSLLSLQKKKELQSRLEALLPLLNDVKIYFDKDSTKKLIAELPIYWVHSNEVLNALKERIHRLLEAFQNNEVIQVKDLVFKAFPSFRFSCILNFCMLLDWRMEVSNPHFLNRCLSEIERPYFYDLLPVPIEGMINECVKLGLDPIELRRCSDNPILTKSLSCIVKFAQKSLIDPEAPAEQHFLKQQGELLKKELWKQAKIDYKDWGENYPEEGSGSIFP